MTNRKQELIERLNREFDICDRHIQRIDEVLDAMHTDIPISVDCYMNLDENQIRCMDQFIFRFSKLQDAMGAKIFRYVLEYLDEDVSSLPMRDILNRLECYRLIDNAEEWGYIRELRNEIAHDYPLLENDVVSVLNELISKLSVLKGIYKRMKAAV
ncbi:MAG: TM1812 family CRISPR-associated protein [Parabacteroides sp.]|nr:TM1812 family CRISPR-associated protein [Parabacteroides sp.]